VAERGDGWRRFRVLRGPFQGFTGELVGFGYDDSTVIVLLNVFGRETRVEMPREDLVLVRSGGAAGS
jgi:transcription antitermination factor NusG